MSHPFAGNRRSLILYSSIWLAIAVGNFFLLNLNWELSVQTAIVESLVSIVLFAFIGLVIWYPIRYIPFRKESPLYSLSAHVGAGIILVLVWLLLSFSILSAIFEEDPAYNSYLSSSFIWRAFIAVVVYLVMVLIYYLISYARRLRERILAEEKLQTLVKETELNVLKSQINPHFLFNSLNSISSLIMTSPEEAREMIIRLSDFLRYSLKHRENEFVPLKEELGRMKDYLAIEQVRFGDKLSYDLDVSDLCREQLVPTMILQPLVENAIKHGVYESLEPVQIHVNCELTQETLRLDVENDFDPDLPSRKGTGLGLQNVSERIRLAYDGKGRVNWSKEGKMFKVSLYIPIQNTSER